MGVNIGGEAKLIIIIFLWLILILEGIKHNKNVSDTAFTLDTSMALRGICSIEIMIGHLGIATGSVVLYPNRKAGILFVGVFLALSGYGLMYSVTNKDDYLDKFLFKRIGKLLFPAYGVFLINIVLSSIIDKNSLNLIKIINFKDFFLGTNWYVWELLMLYIVFYISVKIDKSFKKFPLIIFCFSVVFVCIAYGLKLENPWYGSTFCFVLGISYFIHRDDFREVFVLSNPTIKFIGCCFVMVVSIVLFFIDEGVVGVLVARNMASVFFVIVLLICLHRFSIKNNVSTWLGKYSYEIFLFHPLFINIFRSRIENDVVYSFAVIGVTILASYVYGVCANKLESIMKKVYRQDGIPNHH